ncbi:MAG: DNA adenine methylase [Acidobacteria bacterium]|nr:DNA adenine methylase [Acidobacteriota bacterium]
MPRQKRPGIPAVPKNSPSSPGKPAVAPSPPDMAGYPGSKGAAGLAERIIRQMPPHIEYIEAFAGHAAVYRRKAPALKTWLIDANPNVCERLRAFTAGRTGVDVVCDDFLVWIESYRFSLKPTTLIYVDAPYLRDVRTRLIYDVEFHTKDAHETLLKKLLTLPCLVIVSHYWHLLYNNTLWDWRRIEIPAMTRGGRRVKNLWCNFKEPTLLHDPRFAGGDYRERQNIARKKKRWARKFAKMDRRERQAVAVELAMCDRLAVEMAMRSVPAEAPAQDPAGVTRPR